MPRPANQQFQANPIQTAIAIAYRNPDYTLIADDVLPRVPVGARDFTYVSYAEEEMFNLPDTRVGRRSAPNQVELEGEQVAAMTKDYGIDIPLDNSTIQRAEAAGYDPRARATERATNIVMLDREVRVAKLVSDATKYHADQKLAATSAAFFDPVNGDPVGNVQAMLDNAWMRPNQLVFGQTAWSVYRKHPKVLKSIRGNDGNEGLASREDVARLFEVQRVFVGEARVNIAKPGLAPAINRTWGNVITGQFIDRTVTAETGGVTFGMTAQYGTRIAGSMPTNVGLLGGELQRAGEMVEELIVARRAGFLITLS
jgi:hypothetical protein